MPEYQTVEHDLLVIRAGGAGLRAAIEASAAGASVGLVCKSLLGKAHTVMAEGGVAAALGYVEPKDNWKVHFRDTMKGGRYLNQWRMAPLHAMEAPERVQEHAIHSGMKVYMECTITRLLVSSSGPDGKPTKIGGAFGYWRENGRFVV